MLQITRARGAALPPLEGRGRENGPRRHAQRRLPLVTARPDNPQEETSSSPLSSGDLVAPEEDMHHGYSDCPVRRN